MRTRPFAVEQVRRQGAVGPGVLWRKLVHHAQQIAGAALGEIKGVQPDKGGAERWNLMGFAEAASRACTPPFLKADATTTNAVLLFRIAAKTFAQAGPDQRRAVAPALIAAAQLMGDLMDQERRR
jgi:hypothetical protein